MNSVLARTGLDLDRDVAEADDVGEAGLVGGGRLGAVADDRDDRGVMARPDPPQMQIGDAVAAPGFEPLGDLAGDPFGPHVEEDRAGDADEAPRPIEDHEHADEAQSPGPS